MNKYYVYCLFQNKELVYIGSTTKIDKRIETHSKQKLFDRVRYCELPTRKDMLHLEEYGIYTLNPRMNRTYKKQLTKPDFLPVWKDFEVDSYWYSCAGEFIEMCDTYRKYQAETVGVDFTDWYTALHNTKGNSFRLDMSGDSPTLVMRFDEKWDTLEDLCVNAGGLSFKEWERYWVSTYKHMAI